MPDFGLTDALTNPGVAARLASRGAIGARAAQANELTFGTAVGDIALAPIRGVEAAAQDVWGLADWVSGDALPDYPDDRFFGRSRTIAGGLVEGITNFAAGFVPAVGVLGKAGRIAGVVDLTRKAQFTARAAGRVGRARLISAGRAAAAGALADFAVFDAHEERLSNLLGEFPTLANPVTEFLAASPEDTQAEGRLKNALEGLFVGTVVDVFAWGLRGVRAARRARAQGLSAKATARAVREEVPGDALQGALDEAGRTPIDPTQPQIKGPPVPARNPDLPDDVPGLFSVVFGDEEATQALIRDVAEAEMRGIEPGGNPRNMSAAELIRRGITEHDLALDRFAEMEDGARTLTRAMERLGQIAFEQGIPGRASETTETFIERGINQILDVLHASDSREQVTASLFRDVTALTEAAGRVQGWLWLWTGLAATARRSLDAALSAPDEVAAIRWARFVQDSQFSGDILGGILGMQTEMGRGVRMFGTSIRGIERELTEEAPQVFRDAAREEAEAILEPGGGLDAYRREGAKVRVLLDDPDVRGQSAFAAFLRGALDPPIGMRMFNEFWINALLSGPRSLTINGVAPLTVAVMMPLERVVGGSIRLLAGAGDGQSVSSGIRLALNLFRDADEAFRAARTAVRQRRNILDPRQTISDIRRGGRVDEARAMARAQAEGRMAPGAFDPEVLGADPESIGGQVLRLFDRVVGTPSAVLGGIDEFVKQLVFRSTARDELYRAGMKLGFTGADLDTFIEARMTRLVTDGQVYSRRLLLREGAEAARRHGLRGEPATRFMLDYVAQNFDPRLSSLAELGIGRARTATATDPLTPGTLGKTIENAVTRHPYLRLVAPFTRTPTNLLVQARRRVDVFGPARFLIGKRLGRMPSVKQTRNQFLRDMLTGNEMTKADAVGRFALGVSAVTFFGGMTLAGRITGRGPDEPNRARALRQAGWQPYSIRIGNRWVSYERFDPWAALIGAAADLAEYAQWADTDEQSEVETITAGLVTAVLNQATQKSYLTGIRNFVAALTEPERRAQTFLEQLTGSFVPGAVSSGVEAAGDTHLREVRGVLDAIRNRVPGISGTLEPRRNLLGEPVERTKRLGADEIGSVMNVWMPVSYSEVSDDPIDTELASLKHGFGAPAPRRGGVDLLEYRSARGQTAFDRWQQLHGEVRVGGLDIRSALRRLMRSPEYRRAPRESTPELDSPRIGMIENVIRQYREHAFRQTLREYPELRVRYRQLGLQRRRLSLGSAPQGQQIGIAGYSARLPTLVAPSEARAREPF